MKRTACRIFISVMLGVITTVAVAWFFAAFVRPQFASGDSTPFTSLGRGWRIAWTHASWLGSSRDIVSLSYGGESTSAGLNENDSSEVDLRQRLPVWIFSLVKQSINLMEQTPLSPPRTIPPHVVFEGSRTRYYPDRSQTFYFNYSGWPMKCMWSDLDWSLTTPGGLFGGIQLPTKEPGQYAPKRSLPLYMIPFGFTIDTAIYTMLWFTLLFCLPSTRRKWRISNGRCPACGYNLRGLPGPTTCPECGFTIMIEAQNAVQTEA